MCVERMRAWFSSREHLQGEPSRVAVEIDALVVWERLRHGDFELLVIGDGNARLAGAPWNRVLTDALGRTVFGNALLVCLHAVGKDGDDSRLADVCCIYDEMAKFLSMSGFSAAQYCARPLPIRVKELLKFFEDADCA